MVLLATVNALCTCNCFLYETEIVMCSLKNFGTPDVGGVREQAERIEGVLVSQ